MIPVYNEIRTIQEIIRRVQQAVIEKEIILVDDYSTDGTRECLSQIKTDNIKILFHEQNQGKGLALHRF